jgi:hypothetical protein
VTWTYRIGPDLFPAVGTAMVTRGGRGRRRVKWKVHDHHGPAGVAMATRGGGRGKGRVRWKVPDRHKVAAHWPNR